MKDHNWEKAFEHIKHDRFYLYEESVICRKCGAIALKRRTNGWKLFDTNTEEDCDEEIRMRSIRGVHDF